MAKPRPTPAPTSPPCSQCGNDRARYGQTRAGEFLCGACIPFDELEAAIDERWQRISEEVAVAK